VIDRADIVAEARTWQGTPWRHQARVKRLAVDCVGLIGGVAAALGIAQAREWMADRAMHCYGTTPDPDAFFPACERFMCRVPLADATLGDVLAMAFSIRPQHLAFVSRVNPLYGNPTYLIHAYSSVGKVVENGVAVAKARVLRAYRLPGVA